MIWRNKRQIMMVFNRSDPKIYEWAKLSKFMKMNIFLQILFFWAVRIQKAYAMLRPKTLMVRQIWNTKSQIENFTNCSNRRILRIFVVKFIDRNQMTFYMRLKEECNITSKTNCTLFWLTLISFYFEAQN